MPCTHVSATPFLTASAVLSSSLFGARHQCATRESFQTAFSDHDRVSRNLNRRGSPPTRKSHPAVRRGGLSLCVRITY
jgi:hypothetical protein